MESSWNNQTFTQAADALKQMNEDESKLEGYGLIPEILYRLPPKYVMRSKLVSKSWQAMVSDSSFMPHHAELRDTEGDLLGGLLFFHWMFWLRYVGFTYFDDGGHSWINGAHLDTCSPWYEICSVTNACRGMVCVLGSTANFLVNPSIEEAAPLPAGSKHRYVGDVDSAACGGLFFNESAGSYHVLRMFRRVNGSIGCEMLTVGIDDVWRPVMDAPFPVSHRAAPVFAGGLMLWLPKEPPVQENAPCVLVGFDPKKEAFVLVKLPKGCRAPSDHAGVVKLDGQLCYWERYDAERRICVWVSRDFEWQKLYCIDDLIEEPPTSMLHRGKCDWAPVATWKGKIIMSNGRAHMAYYDRKAKTFDSEIASVPYGRAMTYSGTLVSPKMLLQKPPHGGAGEGAQAAALTAVPMSTQPNIW